MRPSRHRNEAPIGLPSRNSAFWWLYVVALTGAALFIGHSFVGILVLGLFGYYAARPICARFDKVVDSHALAAALTVATVLVPMLMLILYALVRVFQQIQNQFEGSVLSILVSQLIGPGAVGDDGVTVVEELLRNPPSLMEVTDLLFGPEVQQGVRIVDAVFGAVLLLALAVTLSYGLLQYDSAIAKSFGEVVGGPETTVYSYALAVDSDLASVFFGNFLFVLVMSLVATVTYGLTNLVAPPGFNVPMAFTLGALTGIASLLPIVVGKVIYLPIVGYLGMTAVQQGRGYVFVGGVFVAYFLVLDILPQSFLQPYITGKQLNPLVLLFAYILGPILFGWYGFFFLPIVFVLILELIRVVLPELLRGEPIDSTPSVGEGTGASSDEMQETDEDGDEAREEDRTGEGDGVGNGDGSSTNGDATADAADDDETG
ncbi:AI-2E family transporter [Halolamina sp.]|jgi:predicted PurR-regulated permease PerM|uniref:AI-2E family transporter n=1 Tax=Halolamina sp. TaxID=1940283 RepID=UPI000223B87E|nr:permease [halophilic archaeon DL31]